jgi:hypothetical protein
MEIATAYSWQEDCSIVLDSAPFLFGNGCYIAGGEYSAAGDDDLGWSSAIPSH